jgi:signal transduction histidine kinase
MQISAPLNVPSLRIVWIAPPSSPVKQGDPVVRFDGPIDTTVDDTVADHLLSVLREAMSNVARHAQASSVQIEVQVTEGRVTLRVSDNGVGSSDGHVGGRGLANMRTRAERLAGLVEIGPNPTGGTILSFSAPLR